MQYKNCKGHFTIWYTILAGSPAVVQMEMEQSTDVVVGGVILNASYHTISRWNTVPGTVEAMWSIVGMVAVLRTSYSFLNHQIEQRRRGSWWCYSLHQL